MYSQGDTPEFTAHTLSFCDSTHSRILSVRKTIFTTELFLLQTYFYYRLMMWDCTQGNTSKFTTHTCSFSHLTHSHILLACALSIHPHAHTGKKKNILSRSLVKYLSDSSPHTLALFLAHPLHTHAERHTETHAHTHTHTRTHTHTHTHTHTNTHKHTHTQGVDEITTPDFSLPPTQTHTQTHTHTHTHAQGADGKTTPDFSPPPHKHTHTHKHTQTHTNTHTQTHTQTHTHTGRRRKDHTRL